MKLTVLVDNNTYIDQYYYGEPGVSYYIEDEGSCILLDTGYSDLFLKNAKALQKEIQNISTIVLSHGHNDHTWGLKYLMNTEFVAEKSQRKVKLVANPDVFREIKYEKEDIGANVTEEEMKEKFDIRLTDTPCKISKNITFLGRIKRYNSFEKSHAIGMTKSDGQYVEDYVEDDSALAYQTEKGIYIITGCSHAGICNIVEHAKKVCQEERVLGLIGGFHMFRPSERLVKTIAYLSENQVTELYPCHCTSFAVKAEIHKRIPVEEVGVGLTVEW